jgi:hypothetical protein
MKGRCGGKSIFLPAVLCGFLLVLGMMTACGMGGRERAAAGNSSVAIATSSGTGQDSGGTSGTSGLDAGQPALSVQAGSPANPYDIDPAPLTVADCARCHVFHFRHIRESGGGHRIDCRECHLEFHAFNPLRGNYAELMPKCRQCHASPHGEQHSACLSCHGGVVQKLQTTPSKHGLLGCTECHRTHRVASACTECHSAPHGSSVLARFPECLACHLDAHDLPVK